MPTQASKRLQWLRQLSADTKRLRLVEINRGPKFKHDVRGILVSCSAELVLLHVVNDDYFLNGFMVVRTRDIDKYRMLWDWNRIITRVLKLRHQLPITNLQIDLTNWHTAFTSVHRRFPLLTVHRERISDTVCYIGEVVLRSSKTLVLKTIDPAAKWDERRRFRLDDITKLEFGGAYESAIWLAHCHSNGLRNELERARRYDDSLRKPFKASLK